MREHEKIPYDSFAFQNYWGEGMRLPGQSKGLDRWFFQWQWRNSSRANDYFEYGQPPVAESTYRCPFPFGSQGIREARAEERLRACFRYSTPCMSVCRHLPTLVMSLEFP